MVFCNMSFYNQGTLQQEGICILSFCNQGVWKQKGKSNLSFHNEGGGCGGECSRRENLTCLSVIRWVLSFCNQGDVTCHGSGRGGLSFRNKGGVMKEM